MLAALYHGNRDVRVEEVPEPTPGPGDVKIRVSCAGICGTDVKDYFAGPLFLPTTPHPVSGAQIPLIFGHEFSGVVAELGDGAADIAVGQRVAIEPIYTCGKCIYCEEGDYNLCDRSYFHGSQTYLGGMAECTVVKRSMVHSLPESVSFEQGALVEPMSVAMHSVQRAHTREGAVAVVYGAGPIGLGVYLGLRAEGLSDVVVVEPSVERRRAAERLGCEAVLDPSGTDIAHAVLVHTEGRGADVSFDVAGAASGLTAAIRSTRKQGQVIIVAAHESPMEFQPNEILMKEVSVTTSFAYCNDFQRVIGHMAAGKYPTDGWVEHVGLDALPEAFDALRSASLNKVVVNMDLA
jgi:(R,R)-butanediol dehydrogenase/meso-butanediol dehydrogenase/diacetyl reductase